MSDYDKQREADYEEKRKAFEKREYQKLKYFESFSKPTEVAKEAMTEDNKYNRDCKGITIDVYDVLKAFNVTCPAMQHAIKKMLCTGIRGHKGFQQDADEAINSIKRSKELHK